MTSEETQPEAEQPPVTAELVEREIDEALEDAEAAVRTAQQPSIKVLKRTPSERGKAKKTDDEPAEDRQPLFSKEALALKSADHLEIKDWLTQLSSTASVQIHVHRKEPKTFTDPRDGVEKKVAGLVGTYESVVAEEELQRKHGGGTYQLIVKVRNQKGNWQYFSARTIELAGDPRLDDVPRTKAPFQQHAPAPVVDTMGNQMVSKAFDYMAQQANRPAPTVHHGASSQEISAAVQMAIAPLNTMINALTQQLAAKDEEMSRIREDAKKGDPYKDKLLDKMLDTDNARVQAIRLQHESEIRVLKEQQVATENRLRDQHQRDIERMERAHERELSSLKGAYDTQKSALETSQSTQKLVLDSEVKRLEREVTDLKTELAALRAKKEQSVSEKIKEMKELKDLVQGDDDDPEEKGTLERVIEAAGNLPVLAQLANRVGGGEQPQQQPQQVAPQQRTRPRVIRNRTTGQVFVEAPDGTVQPALKMVPAPDGQGALKIPPLDPSVVKEAIGFMEGAFRGGTDAKTFADSARPMIPQSVLAAIRELGIDEFLSKVAQLDATSPLATQGGRNWRRQVAKHLLGEE